MRKWYSIESDMVDLVAHELNAKNKEGKELKMITKTYKVFGMDGHRQKVSFSDSVSYDFSIGKDIRIIELINSDITGTNDFSVIRITRNTAAECDAELNGQLSDGIFENCRTGRIEEISNHIVWNSYGKEIDFEIATNYMNDEILEYLHNAIAPCSEQYFFDQYAAEHKIRFNETWELDKNNPVW